MDLRYLWESVQAYEVLGNWSQWRKKKVANNFSNSFISRRRIEKEYKNVDGCGLLKLIFNKQEKSIKTLMILLCPIYNERKWWNLNKYMILCTIELKSRAKISFFSRHHHYLSLTLLMTGFFIEKHFKPVLESMMMMMWKEEKLLIIVLDWENESLPSQILKQWRRTHHVG